MTQTAQAKAFHALHIPGTPVVLYNIWDPGSAVIVAKAGASALATGSKPVAIAHGFEDGENIPLAMVIDNLKRIILQVDLPVSCDLETGYGATPEEVRASVSSVIAAGAVGFNFEDQLIGSSGLRDIDGQMARISAARAGADSVCPGTYLNARTDIFLKAKPDKHDAQMLDNAVTRAKAYADAGADGFFAPGLADEKLIADLCKRSPLPVNIIALPHVPEPSLLAELGVARISYGPVPYMKMAAELEAKAKAALTSLRGN